MYWKLIFQGPACGAMQSLTANSLVFEKLNVVAG